MFEKTGFFIGIGLMASMAVGAQDEAVALKIGQREVTRTELAAAYRNYVADGKDKRRTVDAFVRDYAVMQRKALAARAAGLDTTSAVRSILDVQKSRLLRPLFFTESEKEAAALKVYTDTKGEFDGKPLLKVAAIFRYLPQNASSQQVERERRLTDSLYNVLQKGGDFLALAKRYSDKDGQAGEGYVPSWLMTGRTWADYEAQAYTLKPGEYTKPFLAVRGFYIIKLLERQPFPTFESVKARLMRYMDGQGITARLAEEKFARMRKDTPANVTTAALRRQVEQGLWRANPAAFRQYRMYEDAVLAAAWEGRGTASGATTLEQRYPLTVNEKEVRSLEKDYQENKK